MKLVVKSFGLVLSLVAFSACPPLSFAQTGIQSQKLPMAADKGQGHDDDEPGPFSSLDEEQKAKRAIRYAEKEYQDNLDRARDLSVLGAGITTSFKENKSLGQEDFKKLEKIEKLAKGIRSAAGGSEDDTQMEKPPADLASAVEMLGDVSHSLKEKVEKTPKHVISAAVIDQANVLLELIRIVRRLPSKV